MTSGAWVLVLEWGIISHVVKILEFFKISILTNLLAQAVN